MIIDISSSNDADDKILRDLVILWGEWRKTGETIKDLRKSLEKELNHLRSHGMPIARLKYFKAPLALLKKNPSICPHNCDAETLLTQAAENISEYKKNLKHNNEQRALVQALVRDAYNQRVSLVDMAQEILAWEEKNSDSKPSSKEAIYATLGRLSRPNGAKPAITREQIAIRDQYILRLHQLGVPPSIIAKKISKTPSAITTIIWFRVKPRHSWWGCERVFFVFSFWLCGRERFVLKSYRYRLEFDCSEVDMLSRWESVVRLVWNVGLEQRRLWLQMGRFINYSVKAGSGVPNQCAELADAKRELGLGFLCGLFSWVLQQTLKDFDQVCKKYSVWRVCLF